MDRRVPDQATIEPQPSAGAPRSAFADGDGRITYDDRDIGPGLRYAYRVSLNGGSFGETWVDVPRASALALEGARPNPADPAFAIAFSLADDSPARLELVDLQGRRVFSREVGVLGAGEHVLSLRDAGPKRAGVYLLRLTQHSRAITKRVVVTSRDSVRASVHHDHADRAAEVVGLRGGAGRARHAPPSTRRLS